MSLTTGHIGVNVTDLARSSAFYQRVLGLSALQETDKFVFLGQDGTLVLTLWHQAEERYNRHAAGLHHLSFQAPDMATVRACEQRLQDLGAPIHHDGLAAHREGSASGGVFFEDPDGTRLEVFATDGAQTLKAPYAEGPTCGFF